MALRTSASTTQRSRSADRPVGVSSYGDAPTKVPGSGGAPVAISRPPCELQGRLAGDTSARPFRQVALAAEVSWSQTAQVTDDLADLGVVHCRQTPGATLVRFVPGNVVAELERSMTEVGLRS